jgi:phosphate starvation-inducible protein PhoH and related proteins
VEETNNTVETFEKKIPLRGIDPLVFFGAQDSNLRFLQKLIDVQLIARGNEIVLKGEAEKLAQIEKIISELIYLIHQNGSLESDDIETVVRLTKLNNTITNESINLESMILFTKRDVIKPRTEGQERYFKSVQNNEIVFAIGPAGTGKTFLAVAMAVARLRDKAVKKIILCRPAVEAGENLGFLPGDFREKVDPYLRPLYDALHDMVAIDKLKHLLESHIIEIVPLAYMRGRTLDNSFVILDEAQNTTSLQMKMFLTRLGANSCAIITGDITQIDLPPKTESGLVQVQSILKGIDGIDFIYFHETDVVRHRLVKQIIKAYEKHGEQNKENES